MDKQTKKGYRLTISRYEDLAGQKFEDTYLNPEIVHGTLAKLDKLIEESTWNLWLQRYKRLAKWLHDPDDEECPKLWHKIKPKKIDWDRKLKDKHFSEQEFLRLLESVDNVMDKAYFGVSFEAGLRPGEALSMNVGDCKPANYGFVITVSGKTGTRTVPIVMFSAYLRHWLNFHPLKHNKEAPLWVLHQGSKYKRISYSVMNSWHFKHYCDLAHVYRWKPVKDKKTGKTRQFNAVSLHYLRHSKVTLTAKNRKVRINTKQANMMFGWSSNSPMFSRYSHLVGADSEDAFLALVGVEKAEENKPSVLAPRKCLNCNETNSADAMFCMKCGYILDETLAKERMEAGNFSVEQLERMDVMSKLFEDKEFRELTRDFLRRKQSG